MAAEDDPFGAFGEDDDDDDEKDGDDCNVVSSTASVPESGQQQARRDPSCGVLVFHNGTEQALLHHVEREMELLAASDQLETAEQVMKLVDQYCFSRHWMMHIGDQKGIILKDFIREFCQEHQNRLIRQTKPEQTVIMVELGTYCGYSAILMAYTILEFTRTHPQSTQPSFRIFSVDVNSSHQIVAQKLVQLAKLQDFVEFVLLPDTTNSHNALTETLQKHFAVTTSKIDFLFIDHDKDLYVSDLQQLEASGWIQKGTHVAADNVVFFDIPYRSYIQQRREQGIVSSKLVMGQLEYVIPEELGKTNAIGQLQDGVELTVYEKDPTHPP